MKLLYASDAIANDQFGFSISLFRAGALANFGYVLGVGAPGSVATYVFINNPSNNIWTQNSRLTPPQSNPLDTPSLFGYSVSANEDILMVGSPGTSNNTGSVVSFVAVNQSNQVPRVRWSQQAVVCLLHILHCSYFMFYILADPVECKVW